MMEQPTIIENLEWSHPPVEGLPYWVWLLVALVVAGASAAAWLWVRRKRGQLHAAARMARPPDEKALEALQALKAGLSEEDHMAFIIEVSRILRVYIQDRFALRAPHRSTEEFLQEAGASQALSPAQRELLGDFLGQCDLVKFARRDAAPAQMETLFATAEQFVRDTIPRPEPNPETP